MRPSTALVSRRGSSIPGSVLGSQRGCVVVVEERRESAVVRFVVAEKLEQSLAVRHVAERLDSCDALAAPGEVDDRAGLDLVENANRVVAEFTGCDIDRALDVTIVAWSPGEWCYGRLARRAD